MDGGGIIPARTRIDGGGPAFLPKRRKPKKRAFLVLKWGK